MQQQWPWVIALSVPLAVGYAALVMWLNNHRRYGAFWRGMSWFEVIVGNLLVAATVAGVLGLTAGLVVVGCNVVWGAPMIVGELIASAEKHAKQEDRNLTA